MTTRRLSASAEPARNEAAERLRKWIGNQTGYHESHYNDLVRDALAAERRATVERIREKLTADVVHLMWEDTTDPAGRIGGDAVHLSDLDAILDEEANRE